MRWSLLGEFYSFFILFILFLRYHWYERGTAPNRRRMLFTRCLFLSMWSIVFNVICVVAINNGGLVPVWVNTALNTTYFLLCVLMCSFFAYLLFDATLEHVYDKHCLKQASVVLVTITAISVLLLVVNLFTGILFYFDTAGNYQRGVLNKILYFLPVVELAFLAVCYYRNRLSVGKRMKYVMRSIPPLIILLVLLQISYPNVLLNGTLSATVSLIIFVAFRAHTEDWDSLTGAGSRSSFMSELDLRSRSQQAVQFIQITPLTLSEVNLQYSYTVGDALLYEISHYLSRVFPQGRLFRTATVTFTMMLPYESEQLADMRLEQIAERMQQDWVLGDISARVNCAIAEMHTAKLCGKPSEVMEKLEYTNTLAKETRGLVRFDESVRSQMVRRNHIIDIIRRSIEEERFRVWYQPIHCCHNNVFCGAEALLRLSEYDGTPIPPDVFIPLAEETGMICDLTWIVLEDVCRLLSSKESGLDTVSVNLSMQQLLDPHLPLRIREYLEKYDLDAKRLKLEITERFVLNDEDYARELLETLNDIGIEINMDDFGTGYSNLSSVLQYPFTAVKLDRSLINTLPENKQAAMMVDALLQVFHNMNMRVVAEGVEEPVQADYLKSRGVDMIQGYYFARPMPESDLLAFLKK